MEGRSGGERVEVDGKEEVAAVIQARDDRGIQGTGEEEGMNFGDGTLKQTWCLL